MRCGEVETYAIPSDHHKHTTVEHVVQPTCTEQGYTELRCVNSAGLPCGKTYIVQGSEPPALGHDYSGDSGIRTIVAPAAATLLRRAASSWATSMSATRTRSASRTAHSRA